jgi:hypothetical protein
MRRENHLGLRAVHARWPHTGPVWKENTVENQQQHEEPSVQQGYEPPALTAVGEFSEDTLGFGSDHSDFIGHQGF